MNWKPDQSHRDQKWLKELQEELQNPVLKRLDDHEYKKAIIAENTRYMQTAEVLNQEKPELSEPRTIGEVSLQSRNFLERLSGNY